jgi:hypothetical protein
MPGVIRRGDADAQERRSLAKSAHAAFQAMYAALGLLARPAVCVPYVLYFLVQMLLLSLYLTANSGVLAPIWAATVEGVTPEILGHYPAHLLLLQPILGRLDMILEILLKSILHGATVHLAARVLRRREISLSASFSSALRRYPGLLGVSIVSSAVVFAAVAIGSLLSTGLDGAARYAAIGGGIAAGLVMQSLFVYSFPLIMLDGASMPAAIASGVSLSLRTFTKTLLVVAVPFILTVPTTLLEMKAEMIALNLSPDFMIHSYVASRLMELVSVYLITVAATAVFIKRRVDKPPGTSLDIGAEAAG